VDSLLNRPHRNATCELRQLEVVAEAESATEHLAGQN
jgi:hypothetical protein